MSEQPDEASHSDERAIGDLATAQSLHQAVLGREPSAAEVERYRALLLSGEDLGSLVGHLLRSREFAARAFQLHDRFPLDRAGPTGVDTRCDEEQMRALWHHVATVWDNYGRTDPYWSVLTSEQWRAANMSREGALEQFYASGESDLQRLQAWLDRNGLTVGEDAVCAEYGCGVGRCTIWLARRFRRVLAFDVSQSHLEAARDWLGRHGVDNVDFILVRGPDDLKQIKNIDVFYSIIVLQHNPPPIIRAILDAAFSGIAPKGLAFFQVPTYALDYRFDLNKYMNGGAWAQHMEMHCLPQRKIFKLGQRHGLVPVEVQPDNLVGPPQWISNCFLLQRKPIVREGWAGRARGSGLWLRSGRRGAVVKRADWATGPRDPASGPVSAAQAAPPAHGGTADITPHAAAVPIGVTGQAKLPADYVEWGYRLVLGREPESRAVVEAHRSIGDPARLLEVLITSDEYRQRGRTDGLVRTYREIVTGPFYVMVELPSGESFWVNLRDRYVSQGIMSGKYEEAETAFVARHVTPGMHCLDIGANLGWFTVKMGRLVGASGSVTAFEPRDDVFEHLAKTVRQNGLTNVRLHHCALGAAPGAATLAWLRSDQNPGGTHLQLGSAASEAADGQSVSQATQILRLDDVIDHRVDFIKLDVEGAEKLVLEGASRILRDSRPIIMSEVSPEALRTVSGTHVDDYLGSLARLGYAAFQLEEDGALGEPTHRWTFGSDKELINVALFPTERRPHAS